VGRSRSVGDGREIDLEGASCRLDCRICDYELCRFVIPYVHMYLFGHLLNYHCCYPLFLVQKSSNLFTHLPSETENCLYPQLEGLFEVGRDLFLIQQPFNVPFNLLSMSQQLIQRTYQQLVYKSRCQYLLNHENTIGVLYIIHQSEYSDCPPTLQTLNPFKSTQLDPKL
jgi:hypothetical protein